MSSGRDVVGGRYWARTSDPQLVELEDSTRNTLKSRGLCDVEESNVSSAVPLSCGTGPERTPEAIAADLLRLAESATDPVPLIQAATAILDQLTGVDVADAEAG